MTYTLTQFADEIRTALTEDPGPGGKERVRTLVEKAVSDPDMVATYLGPENTVRREVIFEDPELGFCVCAHVDQGSGRGSPHNHGDSWAIYGQAAGVTEMTDWRILAAPDGDTPGRVEATEVYELAPGMARLYDVGDVHSPRREDLTRLIRIEGRNLDGVKRPKFEVAHPA